MSDDHADQAAQNGKFRQELVIEKSETQVSIVDKTEVKDS